MDEIELNIDYFEKPVLPEDGPGPQAWSKEKSNKPFSSRP